METADKLKDDESVVNLIETIKELRLTDRGKDPPFIFIESSSGCGKTQMAFNLEKKLAENDDGNLNRVVYLCLAKCARKLPIFQG